MSNIVTSNYTYYPNATQVKSGEFWYDDGSSSTINMDSFLSLMIAQLSNQDFNNAVDDSQFIQQLAAYAQVEAMDKMTEYSKINYATNLIGKDVAVHNSITNEIVYGTVDALNMLNGEMNIYINGVQYDLDSVVQVYPAEDTTGSVTDETDYDVLIEKLLEGLASLKSDEDSSLTSSFTSTLERLLNAIEELLETGNSGSSENDFIGEITEDETTESVEETEETEDVTTDVTEEIAQENASSVESEELNTIE